jgi:hypothetical protein
MPRARATLFDNLRQDAMRNGAWKSPTPQSERIPAAVSHMAAMDSSGIGQAGTMGRHFRTYTAGDVTPQIWDSAHSQPAGVNTDAQLVDAGVAMNARAAYPGRGLTPTSPLARRS